MKQLIVTLLIFSVVIAALPVQLSASSHTYRVQRAFVDETMKIVRDYRLKQKVQNLEVALRMEAARQMAARLGTSPAASALPTAVTASKFQANAATAVPVTAGSSG